MALLFDTPGLKTTTNAVAASPSSSANKKRKRNSTSDVSDAKAATGELNLEKLMKTMASLGGGGSTSKESDVKPKGKKAKPNAEGSGSGDRKAGSAGPSQPQRGQPQQHQTRQPQRGAPSKSEGAAAPNRFKPAKKEKGKKPPPATSANLTTQSYSRTFATAPPAPEEPVKPAARARAPKGEDDEGVESEVTGPAPTAMQTALRAKLAGGRFRMLNESLYTGTGAEAWDLMKDAGAFDEYHAGFRSQSSHWPTNPLKLFKEQLSTRTAGTFVADFGCGDAMLARSLVPQGLNVVSFDLVSKDGWVVEAECSSVPLPGGKKGGQIVDVVVCCLSLMGTDWLEMVREARRVLKKGGELKVAEVTSRFTDVEAFVKLVESVGFESTHKDESNTHFMMFDFTKADDGEDLKKKTDNTTRASTMLKACVYKKRDGK